MDKIKNIRHGDAQKRHDIIFMASMLVWPIAIFLIYYVYANLNMVILAFQKYDVAAEKYVFLGLGNFKKFFDDIFLNADMLGYVKNSFIVYGLSLAAMPVGILVSNHIYKKYLGAGIFRIILFLPSIIASMVWVLMFRYFVERALPVVFDLSHLNGTLITDGSVTFWTLWFYNFWMGFAGHMVLYTGAMARIPTELVEYGKLDGLEGIKELWYLTVPLIFPTITVFLVTGVTGIFTNQLSLYGFFGRSAPDQARTLGYHFFAILFERGTTPSKGMYGYASAAGLSFTLIVAPITIIVKNLLEKYGPSSEY